MYTDVQCLRNKFDKFESLNDENNCTSDSSMNNDRRKEGTELRLAGRSEVLKKRNQLTCLYTNANSLKNKRNELQGKIDRLKPDVVGITEVWMKETYILQGYHPAIRKDRPDGVSGGGVMILIRDYLTVTECTELNSLSTEAVWCFLNLSKSKRLLVGNCYRSPSSTAENNSRIIDMFKQIPSFRADGLLVMGDFNFPSIDWEEGTVNAAEDSEAAKFFDTTQDLFLYQNVSFPTRFREGCNPSRLDLVFSSEEHAVVDIIEGDPLGKSDHITITWTYVYEDRLPAKDLNCASTCKYNFRKGKFSEMNESLGLVNWSCIDNLGTEEAWQRVKCILMEHIKKFVPTMKPKKSGPSAPWWNGELTREVKKKYKLWKTYSRSRSAEDLGSYVIQRNKTTAMIRKARHRYESQIVQNVKHQPKKLYRYIRSQQKAKVVVGPLLHAGKMTKDDHETAEVLHTFFQSVFVQEDDSNMPDFPDLVGEEDALDELTVNLDEVITELKGLDADKATGPDDIPTIVMKKCAEQLARPLMLVFNKTLTESKLPRDWKMAKITPIFKKGSRRSPSNYRPVSLTSQPCKVLERIIRKRLMQHIEQHDLHSPHQHGFVLKKSCQTNLLETLEDWTKTLDQKDSLDVIYLDFKKAFDTVPHARLLKKLRGYGLKGKVLLWIEEFLSDRFQQVVVGNSSSSWGKVSSGVPQGSVLGPMLFTLYVNDLPSLVCSSLKMFADDTKLYRRVQEPGDAQALQEDILRLGEWSDKWLLRFNPDKCTVMHCGYANPKARYFMKQEGGQMHQLTETQVEKDLGVHVTSNLKPTTHCHKAANKAMVALKLMRVAFDRFNTSNFNRLFTTYVRPHLDFCAQAAGPYMRQHFSTLEKVQRRATKLVKGLKHLPYQDRLKRLKLCSMEERVRRGDLIETYKILTGKVRLDPAHFFERDQNQRTRGHHLKLKKKHVNTQARAKFFSNRVVSLWNDLPEEVVLAETTNCFKSRLDRYWTDMDPSSAS